MKIQNDGPDGLTGATTPLARTGETGAPSTGKAGAAPGSKTDQLTLSPEAKLLQAAADSGDGSAVRSDVVERMRALVNDGTVGNDAGSLADAIINSWLSDSES